VQYDWKPSGNPIGKAQTVNPGLTAGDIDKLAQLIPNCVTEALDGRGRVTQDIDFDQLRQELSSSTVELPGGSPRS